MFTRKQCKAIAEILNKARNVEPDNAIVFIRHELECLFAADNPNFDPDRFIDACDATA